MQSAEPASRKIEVSVAQQLLRLYEDDQVLGEWPVSTSKFGEGYEEGSYKTPLGKFKVAEEFGDDQPIGTIFKSRLPIGVRDDGEDSTSDDLILSRILWLEGLDDDNANTKDRYIYIHGTNHEHDIGKPASIGCVRMKNADVVSLYEKVTVGTLVEIVA
ncbi:MAG: L,D-transpeptidase YbiS [Verrucomicrobiales bacterium]|jgi:L,D-transpeptidase YbiS